MNIALILHRTLVRQLSMILACCTALIVCGCGSLGMPASAPAVSIVTTPESIVISAGGTYSGNFNSNDPTKPAVTILTNEPVVIENSTITSRGDIIHIIGSNNGTGSNVTIRNVTATALDPGIAGLTRGAFVRDEEASTLSVTNCTMTGVSFGIYLAPTKAASLTIDNNLVYNMEDRPSDGAGGLIASRAYEAHWLLLNNVVALNGADIGWNQIINTPGQASVEDIIDVDDSSGTSAETAITIHDNYLQGAFSTGSTNYTGGGIMSEGDSLEESKTNAFVQVVNNQIVMTANYGIAITSGHDITMSGNRVVSCGIDAAGNWYAGQSGNAAALWNNMNSPVFFDDQVIGTTGGLVRPNSNGQPVAANLWAPAASESNANTATNNTFDNPCWTNGKVLSNQAEIDELAHWNAKVSLAGQVLGDSHLDSSVRRP